ncbi:MAG TPA: orotidine 5'-phosphate decarboxylase / HUMPS family protein, partial [Planctomycetota bacterium]|nr:orotidine 5'-phosphate decarboxylase / HUMPS family protein [Planctomycetota bacterium]
REAWKGGATWIEAGTPLLKSEGLESIRALRREFPKAYLIADTKTLDAGRTEFEAAAKAGANCATVCVTESDSTVLECIEAGRNFGIDVCVDLLGLHGERLLEVAKNCQEWGAHHVGLHLPIDDQMRGLDVTAVLRQLRPQVSLPIAVAGGVNSETAPAMVKAGAQIVIVGGAISKSADAAAATRTLLKAIKEGKGASTELYKRGSSDEEIRAILKKVSTPNLSDAMHRSGDLPGLQLQTPGLKIVGPAVTVRTYPGDWAKPVEAIDVARPGDVIVVDACGQGPAIWGELASESCLQRKLAGIVIDGAIRDIDSIRILGFPAAARLVTPTAGEPKGFGEIGVTIRIGGLQISPGDWIVGDESGVVRIPRARATEVANRAMDVLEHENRLREEIRRKATLGSVAELHRWEKHIVDGLDKGNGKPPAEPPKRSKSKGR